MAAPHVAGVAALLMSIYPDVSPYDVRTALEETATDLGACGFDRIYGHGLVDAMAAADFLGGMNQGDNSRTNCVETSVSIFTDYFGGENRYYIRDSTGKVVYRGGPYPNRVYQTFVDIFQLPAPSGSDCYEFILEDSEGDG